MCFQHINQGNRLRNGDENFAKLIEPTPQQDLKGEINAVITIKAASAISNYVQNFKFMDNRLPEK